MTRSRIAKNHSANSDPGVRAVQGDVDHIRRTVLRIKPKGVTGPWETRLGTVRRLAYRLTRQLMEHADTGTLERIVASNGWKPTTPSLTQNPFHWCLLAIDPCLEIFANTAARRRAGAELLYAHRHNVPELYLVGFIYQLGGTQDIHERLKRSVPGRMVSLIEGGR